jgi:hypothetical protein
VGAAPFLALAIPGSVSKVIQCIFALSPEKASGLSPYEPLAVLAAFFPTRQTPRPFTGNCCVVRNTEGSFSMFFSPYPTGDLL